MQPQTYTEIIQTLEAKGMMPDRPPSLQPMQAGLQRLCASPGDQVTILVAGTNGKGSVSATLEALFLAAGKSVGLHTSPHLEDTTERIRLNGKDISPERFVEVYQQVRDKTDDLTLSHFEILTLMAVQFFYFESVDYAIFEVGLGGTWDATNAIPHSICVITSLGYDHQNLLGNTIEEIASNKFGIVTPGATVVHSALPAVDAVTALANEVKKKTQSTWIHRPTFSWRVEYRHWEPRFILQTPWGEAPLNLTGPRGAENTTTALTLFETLGFAPGPYLPALSQVRWPGRMEKYQIPNCPCAIYLSGDHNPQGIASLLELLRYYPRRHLHILVGVVRDKDLDATIAPLHALSDTSLYLTEFSYRTRTLENYGPWLNLVRGAWEKPAEALKHMIDLASSEDLILVTGSLYLVGELRAYFKSVILT